MQLIYPNVCHVVYLSFNSLRTDRSCSVILVISHLEVVPGKNLLRRGKAVKTNHLALWSS